MWNYGLHIATTLLALLYLVKDWPTLKKSLLKFSILGIIFLIGIGGLFNTYYTKKNNDDQHQADQTNIANLKTAVDSARKSQEDNTRQFVEAFGKLNQKVGGLETKIKTAGLREEAVKLKSELESTQKALNPPKARLAFSFIKPNVDAPAVTMVSLPVKNDVVHVDFCIMNTTKVEARNGEIMLTICKACEFVSEPKDFFSFPGLPSIQRNMKFDHISAISETQTFSADIKVPHNSTSVEIGMAYRCENCIIPEPRAEVGVIKLLW